MKKFKKHTFVVCAYKQSEYLEECIQSLIKQNVQSNIIIQMNILQILQKNMIYQYI